ncbi:MAG TPA: hypothetical protein VFC78_12280 [Tepidisphaeraceae bacterium]|nr:hypothetical protein [Tepidisphaeraceae bacterium]
MRTTKSVWPLAGSENPIVGGMTCEDNGYVDWVKSLQGKGFEIALHNVTYHTSTRERTIQGIDRFRDHFGHDPCSLANHVGCREGVHWGSDRLSGVSRLMYKILAGGLRGDDCSGHVPGDPLFWGDVCHKRIKYVRNFVFPEINTLKACPYMPYHDPRRPLVRYWFAGSRGEDVDAFNHTIREENQDRLEEEGGACIMYTHFGKRFFVDGRLNSTFEALMERLSRKNGWFVPVATLLDHLLAQNGEHQITHSERAKLERRWIWQKLRERVGS